MGTDNTTLVIALSLFGLLLIVIVLGILVVLGNLTAMKILAKLGVAVFSSDIVKDYKLLRYVNKEGIGWLNIPGICYSPIMYYNDGFYKTHNFLNKETAYGELYLLENKNIGVLKRISKKSNNIFKDLSVITGSIVSRSSNIRQAYFSQLRKYTNTELRIIHPDIILMDNGVKRIFTFLFAVEVAISDKGVKFSNRKEFIESMRELAYEDSGRPTDKDIIILRGNTDIDNLMLFMVEK